jgi:SAM-dependent methyltransferase
MADVPYLDAVRLYSDDYFLGGDGEYLDYLSERTMLIKRGATYAGILSRFIEKPGRLLDIGAAAGFLLKGLVKLGWDGSGVEPNEKMAEYGRTQLGLKMFSGTIESYTEIPPKEKYDLICLVQVIAHFLDPKRVVRSCAGLLNPGGFVLIETWNWRSLTARLAGRWWHEYNPPYVIQWFSKRSLDGLMLGSGFELLAGGRPRKQISGQHAKFLLKKKLKNSACGRGIGKIVDLCSDDRLLPYPGGDLFWALYRKKEEEEN